MCVYFCSFDIIVGMYYSFFDVVVHPILTKSTLNIITHVVFTKKKNC